MLLTVFNATDRNCNNFYITRREKRQVPFILTSCVREVERRGMNEVGIYRVSGSTSDVSRLKKAFETSKQSDIKLARISFIPTYLGYFQPMFSLQILTKQSSCWKTLTFILWLEPLNFTFESYPKHSLPTSCTQNYLKLLTNRTKKTKERL